MQKPKKNLFRIESMFENAISFNADLSKWDTSNIKQMISMFRNAKAFQGTGTYVWDTSKVLYFEYTFQGAISFDANLSNWNISKAYKMVSRMISLSISL